MQWLKDAIWRYWICNIDVHKLCKLRDIQITGIDLPLSVMCMLGLRHSAYEWASIYEIVFPVWKSKISELSLVKLKPIKCCKINK